MKNKILLIIMFLPLVIFAQAPGYLGKKVFIGGGVTYAPVFSWLFTDHYDDLEATFGKYITYNGEYKSIFLPPLSYNAQVQFVVSEHNTLQLGVSFQKFGLLKGDPEEYTQPDYDQNYDPYNDNGRYNSSFTGLEKFDYARASYTRFTLGFTHSLATAPIGIFYGNTLNFLIADIEAVDIKGNAHTVTQAYDVGYSFTYGYRRVIKDVVVLETATDFNFYIGGLIGYFGTVAEEDPVKKLKHYTLSSQYFNNIATLRVSAYYLF